MALKGVLYGVKVNEDFMECEIDCELTITADMVNKSGSHSGRYRHYRYGYISWSITCNARAVLGILNSSSNSLIESQLEQRELEVYISARQSNTNVFDIGGTVLIPNQVLSFPNTGFASHNVTFQGSGPLNMTAEELSIIIDTNPIETAWPDIYDSN